ncbi:MAG TPA: ABC transporter permease [Tepidiformaceae bacterium]|nr:ABC transporter permease [Tepidiformaceae bacterium]
MTALTQYRDLVSMQLRSMRSEIWFIALIQIVLSTGLVVGFGFIIPNISDATATFLITGTATQAITTVGLVMLPQMLAQSKEEGRMEYFLTMPISREAYLASLVTVVAMMALPGVAFCVIFGAWHYGVSLQFEPAFVLVALLGVFSMAGVGVAMTVYSPHQQVTNALTQLIIFYVLFFAPVLMPREHLPSLLQFTAHFAPPTYAADGVRATLTDLPGTHLGRSLLMMAGFATASLALSSAAIRRRG